MEAEGWGWDSQQQGFLFGERVFAAGAAVAEWVASHAIQTLRDHLGVPFANPRVGPTHIYSTLPGVPEPTEEQRVEMAELLRRLEADIPFGR